MKYSINRDIKQQNNSHTTCQARWPILPFVFSYLLALQLVSWSAKAVFSGHHGGFWLHPWAQELSPIRALGDAHVLNHLPRPVYGCVVLLGGYMRHSIKIPKKLEPEEFSLKRSNLTHSLSLSYTVQYHIWHKENIRRCMSELSWVHLSPQSPCKNQVGKRPRQG